MLEGVWGRGRGVGLKTRGGVIGGCEGLAVVAWGISKEL